MKRFCPHNYLTLVFSRLVYWEHPLAIFQCKKKKKNAKEKVKETSAKQEGWTRANRTKEKLFISSPHLTQSFLLFYAGAQFSRSYFPSSISEADFEKTEDCEQVGDDGDDGGVDDDNDDDLDTPPPPLPHSRKNSSTLG